MDLCQELEYLTSPSTGVTRGLYSDDTDDTLVKILPSELRRIHGALTRARLQLLKAKQNSST